jgi:flagellar biosynthetic protein FliQ
MAGMDLAALASDALRLALSLSLPALLAALVVSVLVSFLEFGAQGQDSSLGFLPRLLAVGAALFLGREWLADELNSFGVQVFRGIALVAR